MALQAEFLLIVKVHKIYKILHGDEKIRLTAPEPRGQPAARIQCRGPLHPRAEQRVHDKLGSCIREHHPRRVPAVVQSLLHRGTGLLHVTEEGHVQAAVDCHELLWTEP